MLEALTWFKGAEKGVHLEAMLMHYSTINPTYPRTIDIAPSVFTELSQLYTTVWDIRSRYASCPKHYQEQLRKDYTALDTSVTANQSVLATDTGSYMEYQLRADALLTQLNDIFARQDFYSKVLTMVGTEPGNGAEVVERVGQQQWMYGLSTYSKSSAVVISSMDMNYAESWTIGWREHTFEFGPDDRYLIVGWQVISNWGDGSNGSWWKATNQILATHYAAVHVKSQYDRGCNWSMRVYYVYAKDYQF